MKSFVKGILIATLISAPAFAGVKEDIKGSGAGYGKAGCGLGGLIVKQNNWLQIFAATLNGISGNQTFAITTGTSGCDGGIVGGEVGARKFIETNREVLAKDISRGSGETLTALAQVAGCADVSAMGRTLQSQYSSLFPTASASDVEVSANVVGALKSDSSLACTL